MFRIGKKGGNRIILGGATDVVEANVMAYVNAMNKIVEERAARMGKRCRS